jgi:hypothetical protein
VISGVTYEDDPIAANDEKEGSTVPYVEVVKTLTFSPHTGPSTAAAGKTRSDVTFTTHNPDDPMLDKSDVMTFYRFTPANWTFVGSSPVAEYKISAAATPVTLTAHTNLQWWGQATDNTATATPGEKKYSDTPAAYTPNDQITVTVPARPLQQNASWNASLTGTVTVQAGYDGQPGIPALDPPEQFSLNREAYTLDVTASGEDYNKVTLNASTNAERVYLTLKLTNNTKVGEASAKGTSTIELTPNTGTAGRTVNVYNDYGGLMTTFIQPPRKALYYHGGGGVCSGEWSVYNPGNINDPKGRWVINVADGEIWGKDLGFVSGLPTYWFYTVKDHVITTTTTLTSDRTHTTLYCIRE